MVEKEKPEFIEEIDYHLAEILRQIKKFNIKELILRFEPNKYSVEWQTQEKFEEKRR